MSAILRPRRALSLCAALLCAWVLPVRAEQSVGYSYTYDRAGQLVRVIDSLGTVVTYNYDLAGNLLSVTTKTTADLGPPVLGSVTPSVVNRGETVLLVLDGSNLLLGSVTLNDPELQVLVEALNDDQGFVVLEVPLTAALGTATLTVTTPLGSDSIPLTVLGPLPKLAAVAPDSGTSLGGTSVTLRGQNLTVSSAVSFGGVPAAAQSFVDSTLINAVTPAGAAGAVVGVSVTNPNGSTTLPDAFTYRFPFGLPGAIAIELSGAGTLRLTLTEPVNAPITVNIVSSDPAVASAPASLPLAAGVLQLTIPISAGVGGIAHITVEIAGVELSATVFVLPPFEGDLDLVAPAVGGVMSGPPQAAPIGGVIVPTQLATLLLDSGTPRDLTVTLSSPAPLGGLCASLRSSNPASASVPEQVCIAEGEQELTFTVTPDGSGEAFIEVDAGADSFQFRVRVNLGPTDEIGALAAPLGTLPAPIGETLAPAMGVLATPIEETLAAPVGVEVQ